MQQNEIQAIRSYLYSMVRNKCINRLNKKNIVNPCSIMEIKQIIANEFEEAPIEVHKRRIVYEQVMNVVDTFPTRMKEIFKLKFLENYKHNEIADELGISVNTVKSQLRRAKSKIEQFITLLIALFLNM